MSILVLQSLYVNPLSAEFLNRIILVNDLDKSILIEQDMRFQTMWRSLIRAFASRLNIL